MFVTGGILALNAFIAHPNINIMVVGEHVNKESTITLRAVAIEKNRRGQMLTYACQVRNTIDLQRLEVMELKSAMIAACDKTVCLAIAAKLNADELRIKKD